MNFMCDIYAFEHVHGGVTIYVANSRPSPPPPSVDTSTVERYVETSAAQHTALDAACRVPIGLPEDGAVYHGLSFADAAAKLRELRSMGYNLPDSAIAALDGEALDEPQRQQST